MTRNREAIEAKKIRFGAPEKYRQYKRNTTLPTRHPQVYDTVYLIFYASDNLTIDNITLLLLSDPVSVVHVCDPHENDKFSRFCIQSSLPHLRMYLFLSVRQLAHLSVGSRTKKHWSTKREKIRNIQNFTRRNIKKKERKKNKNTERK